jgi:hypothetical protein
MEMSEKAETSISMTDYDYQKEVYERQNRAYGAWSCNLTVKPKRRFVCYRSNVYQNLY